MINLIPLLPFDGGHVAIAIYEKIQERRLRRRRYFADVSRLLPLTYAFILVLGVLAVSTIYLDIAAPARRSSEGAGAIGTVGASTDPPDRPARTPPTRWRSAATRRSRCSR